MINLWVSRIRPWSIQGLRKPGGPHGKLDFPTFAMLKNAPFRYHGSAAPGCILIWLGIVCPQTPMWLGWNGATLTSPFTQWEWEKQRCPAIPPIIKLCTYILSLGYYMTLFMACMTSVSFGVVCFEELVHTNDDNEETHCLVGPNRIVTGIILLCSSDD